jgi:hypothetical protein
MPGVRLDWQASGRRSRVPALWALASATYPEGGEVMFELEVMTNVRLMDVVVLSQKNRAPDEDPGAKLKIAVDVPNEALSMFDGRMLSALYTRNTGNGNVTQMPLEGVAPVSEAPDLTHLGQHVPSIPWSDVCVGYTLSLDVGDRKPLVIENCTASGWRIFPKSGGTITVKFNIESPDVSGTAFGKLAKCKSREVRATLVEGMEAQRGIEDDEARPSAAPAPATAQEPAPEPAASAPASAEAAKRKRAPRTLEQKMKRAARENVKAAP